MVRQIASFNLVWLLACAPGELREVELQAAGTLEAADAFERLEIGLFELSPEPQLVFRGSLSADTPSFERDQPSLNPEGNYRYVAAANTTLCRSGLVVGRSVPFNGTENGNQRLRFGCSDEWNSVGNLPEARLGMSLQQDNSDGVIVVGGARRLTSAGSPEELQAGLYRYLPSEDRFEESGSLLSATAFPWTVFADDTLVLGGGATEDACSDRIERVVGSSASSGTRMATARCRAQAVLNADGRILVAGGLDTTARALDAELLDGRGVLQLALVEGSPSSLVAPDAVALSSGEGAFALGGADHAALSIRFDQDADCGSLLCAERVSLEDLEGGLRESSVVRTQCEDSSPRLWVAGGLNDENTLAAVWCGTEDAELSRVSTLPEGRRGHQSWLHNGTQWLLSGGVDAEGNALGDALIASLPDPCSCEAPSFERVTFPNATESVGSAGVVLADESVVLMGLATGGAAEGYEASTEVLRLFPRLSTSEAALLEVSEP